MIKQIVIQIDTEKKNLKFIPSCQFLAKELRDIAQVFRNNIVGITNESIRIQKLQDQQQDTEKGPDESGPCVS